MRVKSEQFLIIVIKINMEHRVRYGIFYMGFLMLILAWNTKLPLADLQFSLICGLIGFFLIWNFNFNASIRPRPIIEHLVFHIPLKPDEHVLSKVFSWNHNKFSWIVGISSGLYVGYILSVAYNAYYSLHYMLSIPLISNCLASIAAFGCLTSIEQVKGLRLYAMPYYDDIEEGWSVNTLLQSVVVCYSVGEFGGLFGTLYATFFEVVYYYLYIAYTQHFEASMIVLGIYAVYNTIIFLICRRNRQKCCDKPHHKEEQMRLPFRI
jgi:hypothetical protein